MGRQEERVNGTFNYDDSRWPIVRVISPERAVDDATFERHIQRLTAYLERRQPLVFVFELNGTSFLSVVQRERIRRHEAEQRDLIAQFQRGVAIVVHTAFQRAMIGALFWLIRTPSPTQTFGSAEQAMTWANAVLGQGARLQRSQAPGRARSMRRGL
jgi:hypothetical protein